MWTTDKDGPIMDLLPAEITARTGKDPGEHFGELTAEFGTPYTGTHDDATNRGWFEALPEDHRRNVWNHLKRPAGNSDEVAWELTTISRPGKASRTIT